MYFKTITPFFYRLDQDITLIMATSLSDECVSSVIDLDSSSDFEFDSSSSDVEDEVRHNFSSPWHFSDVVLVVKGTEFHVHKSTLSMWSPVFEKMFTSEFLESTAQKIPLPGKRAKEIKVLLNLMYSCATKQNVTGECFI
jgi:hypothetical protein